MINQLSADNKNISEIDADADGNHRYKTVIIMAGGTGGHIFPGLAVAERLIEQNWSVSWMGSAGGMEEKIVKNAKIDIDLISVAGLRGKGVMGWLIAPFRLLFSIYQAVKVLRKRKCSLVIGFGGYASGPGGIATILLGKTLYIHEQNAVAGLTNRLLANFSRRIFLAFPNAINKEKKTRTIGNPIRENIIMLNRSKTIQDNNSVNILIIGGSRGAQIFNQRLPVVLSSLIKQEIVNIHHQCGKGNIEETLECYLSQSIKTSGKLMVNEFIDDMTIAYQWADLVICRAGALTVSEVAAVGIAAIFIPYPYAVDDHQMLNAKWLVDNSAAIIVDQSEIDSASTKQKIFSLVQDKNQINRLAENARKVAYLNATEEIVQACNQAVEEVA